MNAIKRSSQWSVVSQHRADWPPPGRSAGILPACSDSPRFEPQEPARSNVNVQVGYLRSGKARGSSFTLIELLVVIAIIGLLAALLMNLLPRANDMKVRTRVKAELAQVEMAIEHYKEKRGYYPPDHPSNPGTNSLYYELVGTTFDGNNTFTPLNGDPPIL